MFGFISPVLQRGVSGFSHNLSGLEPAVAHRSMVHGGSRRSAEHNDKSPRGKYGDNENLTDFRRPSDTAPKYLTVLHRCPKRKVSEGAYHAAERRHRA